MRLSSKLFSIYPRLFKVAPWRTTLLTSSLVLAGLLDVVSVLSAAPALELLFSRIGMPLSPMTQRVGQILTGVGIPFTLPWVAALFGFLLLIKFLFMLASTAFAVQSRVLFEEATKQQSFTALLQAEWRFFVQERTGQLINTLTTESAKAGSASLDACRLFSFVCQAFFQLMALFVISWRLTCLSLIILLPVALATRLLYKYSYRFGTAAAKANSELFTAIAEYLHLMKIIKGFAAEKQTYRMFDEKLQTYKRTMFRCDFTPQALSLAMEPFTFVSVISIAFIGVHWIRLPFSLISIFLFTLYRLVPAISQISVNIARLSTNLPGLEVLDAFMKNAQQSPRISAGTHPLTLAQDIHFEQVSFAYQKGHPVLQSIDLQIPAGRTIAITGISGSGKSTLIDLLMGFNIPTSGRIVVDGKDLNTLELEHWRHQIGYVPQDAMLFHDTLYRNVAWSAVDPTEKDVMEACRLANVDEFASRAPLKYQSPVGEKGLMLSGGQRQRVALARALVRHPRLLILDEATSALDSESERFIQESLRTLKGHLTILIIAHRLSTIRDCDIIYLLESGRIVESGTYSELIQANGRFRQMAQSHGQ